MEYGRDVASPARDAVGRMSSRDCRVDICPDGPALVRGARSVETEDGTFEVTRPVVAVCLCGKTQRPPWCDATHKLAPRRTN